MLLIYLHNVSLTWMIYACTLMLCKNRPSHKWQCHNLLESTVYVLYIQPDYYVVSYVDNGNESLERPLHIRFVRELTLIKNYIKKKFQPVEIWKSWPCVSYRQWLKSTTKTTISTLQLFSFPFSSKIFGLRVFMQIGYLEAEILANACE